MSATFLAHFYIPGCRFDFCALSVIVFILLESPNKIAIVYADLFHENKTELSE